MKKLKFLLFAAVACLGIGFASLGANAAAHDYGQYKVTTTTNANDTANWNFAGTPEIKNDLAVNDTINGGIVVGATRVRARSGYLDVYTGASANAEGGIIYVPVPAGSAGKITVVSTGTNASRWLYLNNDSTKKIANAQEGSSISLDFKSEDISTYGTPAKSYLKLVGICTDAAKKEVKIGSIVVTLSTGAYEATAKLVKVTYMDGDNELHVEEVETGSSPKYMPTKWQNDLEGLYTDAACTQKYTPGAVTDDLVLYTSWTPWASGVIKDEKVLDLSLMVKGFEVFGTNTLSKESALTGTIYTVLPGASFLANKATVPAGSATHAIKTGGAANFDNHVNGLAINCSNAGTLTLYVKTASSGKNPVLSLFNDEKAVATADKGAPADAAAVTISVPAAGKYYLGSTEGSVYIYHMAFAPTAVPAVSASLEQAVNEPLTAVRYIGTISGVSEAELADLTIELELTLGNGKKATETITTVYSAVANAKDAKADTWYVVFKLTDLNTAGVWNGQTLSAILHVTLNGKKVSSTATNAITLPAAPAQA